LKKTYSRLITTIFSIFLVVSLASATDLQNIESVTPQGTQDIFVNGTLNLNNNNPILNPTQVDGVDLDNPGNGIIINGDQYAIGSNSIAVNELNTGDVDGRYVNRAGDSMTGNLKISGNSEVDVDIGDVTASGITDSEAAGILTSWDTDQAFFGLRDYGDDRKDVVIANEQSADNIRFQVSGNDRMVIYGDGEVDINSGNLDLNSNDISSVGSLQVDSIDLTGGFGTGGIDMSNEALYNLDSFSISDPGLDGAIEWSGSSAAIYSAPLDDSNSDGYLQLVNDGGIAFEPSSDGTTAATFTTNNNLDMRDNRVEFSNTHITETSTDDFLIQGRDPDQQLELTDGGSLIYREYYDSENIFELDSGSSSDAAVRIGEQGGNVPLDMNNNDIRNVASFRDRSTVFQEGLIVDRNGVGLDSSNSIESNGGWLGLDSSSGGNGVLVGYYNAPEVRLGGGGSGGVNLYDNLDARGFSLTNGAVCPDGNCDKNNYETFDADGIGVSNIHDGSGGEIDIQSQINFNGNNVKNLDFGSASDLDTSGNVVSSAIGINEVQDEIADSKNSANLGDPAGWYRIASNGPVADGGNGGDRASAKFIVEDTERGEHSTTVFEANVNYNGEPTLTLTSRSAYGGNGLIERVRLVHGQTYEGTAVEIYVDGEGASGNVEYQIYNDVQDSGWSPVDWNSGSVPSGFSTTVLDLTTKPVMATAANGGTNDFEVRRDGSVSTKGDLDISGQLAVGSTECSASQVILGDGSCGTAGSPHNKDLVAGDGLLGGANDVLVGSDSDVTVSLNANDLDSNGNIIDFSAATDLNSNGDVVADHINLNNIESVSDGQIGRDNSIGYLGNWGGNGNAVLWDSYNVQAGNAITISGGTGDESNPQIAVTSGSIGDNEIADNTIDNSEVQNGADFTFNGVTANSDVTINGDTDTSSGSAPLNVNENGGETLRLGGNEIDSVNDALHLQNNAGGDVRIRSDLDMGGNNINNIGGLGDCGSTQVLYGDGSCGQPASNPTLSDVVGNGNSINSGQTIDASNGAFRLPVGEDAY